MTSSALSKNWANPTDIVVAALMVNLRRGWSMKAEMLAQLIADALMGGGDVTNRKRSCTTRIDAVYTSEQFQRLLAELS